MRRPTDPLPLLPRLRTDPQTRLWGRLCLPRLGLPDSVSSVARFELLASFMQQIADFLRFCCTTISSTPFCRTRDKEAASGRSGSPHVCVCVWKMEIPISGDFCRLLGSAKSNRLRTTDSGQDDVPPRQRVPSRQQGIQASKHPRSIQASDQANCLWPTVSSPCIFPLTNDLLRFVRRHQKLNNIYDHCDIFVVVSCLVVTETEILRERERGRALVRSFPSTWNAACCDCPTDLQICRLSDSMRFTHSTHTHTQHTHMLNTHIPTHRVCFKSFSLNN